MKQKTHKAAAKRLKVTKNGKVKHKKRGQSHFKSRKSGDQVRNLRNDRDLDKAYKSTIKEQLLPNNDIK